MKRAIQDTLPVLFAYFPIGILFGHLFVEMGFPWYMAPIMSAIVYGGSIQFLTLGLLASEASLLEISLGAILLSSRNFFYGLAFLERGKMSRFQHFYTLFGLVDATYSLLIADPSRNPKYATYVNVLIHGYWIAGTFLGAVVNLPQLPYLEFALPALFTCIAIDHWNVKAAIVAILSAILAKLILPSQFLLVAISLAALYFIIANLHRKEEAA